MTLIEDITAIAGKENVTDDELELICFSRDLAPIPDELLKGFGQIKPDVAARPTQVSQVADIVKYAFQKNIPVIPRGGGSWGLGGGVARRGRHSH